MDKQTLFEKNLRLLSKNFNPKLAQMVSTIDSTHLSVSQNTSGEINFCSNKNGKDVFLHSNVDANHEAYKWFNSLEMENIDVLYVYGIGAGHYYNAIEDWLKKNPERYLVFLEDDLAILQNLARTEKGHLIFKNPQVIIHYFDENEDLNEQLAPLPWFFVSLTPCISALQYYQKNKPQLFSEIEYFLSSRSSRMACIMKEELGFGTAFFNNFYRNILFLNKNFHGTQLFKKFRGVPAIICGSGPSLAKNLSLLKEFEHKALIIAGGSALTALSFQSILPHVAAAFGADSLQEKRLKNHLAFETPLFFQNRLFYRVCWETHGPRLVINKPEGYPIIDWFEEKIETHEKGSTEGGVSIVNFCTSLARDLGCNPIIFVGLDLAYTKGSWYSQGVMSSEEQSKTKAPSHGWKEVITRKDLHNRDIQTTWNWLAEAEWIENFAELNQENFQLINATEGGLKIQNLPHIPLKEVAEKYLKRNFDIKGRLHTEIIQNNLEHITTNTILSIIGQIYDSLERCIHHCDNLLLENLEILKDLELSREIPEELDRPEGKKLKDSLNKEIAYKYILAPLEEALEAQQMRHLFRIKRENDSLAQTKSILKLLSLQTENIVFIKRAAEVNQEIIEDSLEEFENQGEDISSFFSKKNEG